MDESRSFDVYDDISQVDHAAARRSRCCLRLWWPRLRLFGVGMLRVSLWIVMIALMAGTGAFAQDDVSLRWLERASVTRAKQPAWLNPLITSSPNLEESAL